MVVWDKEDYVLEASNQLRDSNVYLKLDSDVGKAVYFNKLS